MSWELLGQAFLATILVMLACGVVGGAIFFFGLLTERFRK